jgi:polyhydroxybutyrate depolymerase
MACAELRRLACVALALVPLAGRAAGFAPGDHEIAVDWGGRTRRALVRVPPAATAGAPLPVLVSYHGGGGDAASHRRWIGLDAVADRDGFVAVYPFGTGGLSDDRLLSWNAGACCGYAARENVDDVGATFALLAALARELPLDPTRVYASGMSNGSMMAFRLAHDAGDRVAAIATVAGVAVFTPFAPKRPMPILHFHSADDPRAPFAGGLGPRFPFGVRVSHPPVMAALGAWAGANHCASEPVAKETVRAADAAQSATHLIYPGCAAAAPIELWKLAGAGHVWPGAGELRIGQSLLGAPTRVVDANALAWEFLRTHRREGAPPLASAP